MDFKVIKNAVAQQFNAMCKMAKEDGVGLFRANVDKDKLWETYLASFPEGTNSMFRERTEHDCSGCRSFIRAVGNVVAITSKNEIVSIWDVDVADKEPAYQAVADALAKLVKSKAIENIFLSVESTAGTDKNFEEVVNGTPIEWQHFFVNIPREYVVRGVNNGTKLSDARALYDVLKRSLDELTEDAVETVLDLIAQNSLYRGAEHKMAVSTFRQLQKEYAKLKTEKAKEAFVWRSTKKVPVSVSKIRNTSIGTLLVDLSNEVDIEEAVREFEAMVAPMNYKRPTAIVTPAMIERAKQTVEELGLTSALSRRHAVLSDISVNDILFVDRTAKPKLGGNVFDDLVATAPDKKPKNFDKVEEVHIDKFISDILPRATSLEVMFENQHIKNLVNIIAPQDPTAGKLFKWDNNFSWAYKGDVADSIKEKVKAAGGNVTGDLCCRLAWFNYDDLDLHMLEPNGTEIYFSNKRSHFTCGQLDVDMNAGYGKTRTPVENIFYGNRSGIKEGVYTLYVRQFSRRENVDVGFEVEIDFMGDVHHFAYDKMVTGDVQVAKFKYSHKNGIEIIESLPSSKVSKEVWGLMTNKFHKVNVMMYSPNHWESSGSGVGNKHYMFIIEGCNNPKPARGFFNEYLDTRLDAHRKVFELLGGKLKVEPTDEQMAGLGFSSTQHDAILCRVKGSINRVIKIVF